jgi:hypothetical protein
MAAPKWVIIFVMLEPALRIPPITALGGLLVRWPGGWSWADGMPEPRVRDRLLADLAPAFESLPSGYPATAGLPCTTGWIGIPEDWRNPGFWPGGCLHPVATREIETMVAERRRVTRGQVDAVYALSPAPREGVAARRQTAPRKGAEILGRAGTWRVVPGACISVDVWAAAMGVIVGGAWDPDDEDWLLGRAELLV